ncbi:hypothetical protein ACTGWG_12900, partial [Streptococcus suis]
VFGRMKGVFGVRRVHVRGQKVVETEIGFLLMSMNLTKLAKKLGKRPITKYIEKGSKVLSTLEPFSIYKLS